MICEVALEGMGLGYDKLYTYALPAHLKASAGCRVKVPFGRGDRERVGMVMSISEEEPTPAVKTVLSLLDNEPVLPSDLTALAVWLRETTFCTYYDALRAMLPPGLSLKLEYLYALLPQASETPPVTLLQQQILSFLGGQKQPVSRKKVLDALGLTEDDGALEGLCGLGLVDKLSKASRKIGDEKVTMIRLRQDIGCLSDVTVPVTAAQKRVVELLLDVRQGNLKEICYFSGVSRAVTDKLRGAELVEYYRQEVYRSPFRETVTVPQKEKVVLNESQQQAYEGLLGLWQTEKSRTAVLYGVTGSGKTEVFLRLIESVLAAGQGAVLMVPEIALTPQTVRRFQGYFGERVAVLHSGLSMGERLDEWKRVRRGKARLVVGTRSAVFAPMEGLGLMILDEEQESSYQSESTPRYHARSVAAKRMAQTGGLLVLASATPSIETYYYAKKGVFSLFTLAKRYGQAKLPDVYILDMAACAPDGGGESISKDLEDHLRLVLERKEQAILLLNRRGYHATTKCAICGQVAQCPNCSVALTFHAVNGSLMCHYCGYIQPGSAACAHCGKSYKQYSGMGTQKAEEELQNRLPDARILRMDTDSTVSRYAYERQFGAFGAGEYDILLGTQMVAKGLDFANVTLVGVLNADAILYAQDYRSSARAFNLFTQVVGRAGRGEKAGLALLQTYTPDNRILELSAAQDYRTFYEMEIESRRLHLYPPFCHIVGLTISSMDWKQAHEAAQVLAGELTRRASLGNGNLPLRVLGPTPPPMSKLAGRYRQRILLKCRFDQDFRDFLWGLLLWTHKQKGFEDTYIAVEQM